MPVEAGGPIGALGTVAIMQRLEHGLPRLLLQAIVCMHSWTGQ